MDESGGAPEPPPRPGLAAGVAAVPVGNAQHLLAGRPADAHAAFAAAQVSLREPATAMAPFQKPVMTATEIA